MESTTPDGNPSRLKTIFGIISVIGIVFVSVTTGLSNLKGLDNFLSRVSIIVILTVLIVGLLGINFVIRRDWRNAGVEKVKGDKKYLQTINSVTFVAIVFLGITYLFTDDGVIVPKLPDDSRFVRVLVLPFREAVKSNHYKVDYTGEFKEILQSKADSNSELLKVAFIDLKKEEMPYTDSQAIAIGKKNNADIVIWGSFEENVQTFSKFKLRYSLTANFSFFIDPSKAKGTTREQTLTDLSGIRSGYLLNDVTHVINWAEGMASLKALNLEKAKHYFTLALTSQSHLEFASDTYYKLGLIYTVLGDYQKSNENLGRFADIEKNKGDTVTVGYIVANSLMGANSIEIGDYQTAADKLVLLRRLLSNLKERPSVNTVIIYSDIGMLSRQLEQINEAEGYYLIAKKHYEQIGFKEFDYMMVIKYNLGLIKMKMGDNARAIQLFREALDYPGDFKSHDGILEAKIYNSWGNALAGSGKLEQGITFMQRSFSLFKRHLTEFHPDLADQASNLTSSFSILGKLDSAEYYSQFAKRIFEHSNDTLSAKYFAYLINTGELYKMKKNYVAALAFNHRAAAIPAFKNTWLSPYAYIGLAIAYEENGDFDSALHYLEYSAGLLDALHIGHDQDNRWGNYYLSMAKINEKRGQGVLACEYAAKAFQVLGKFAQYSKDAYLLEVKAVRQRTCTH